MRNDIIQLFENCGMETPSEYLIEGASAKKQKNFKIFREAMADGLNVVYDGPNFIIGVPTTYEALSHFKKPVTEWRTAYPDMYTGYMDKFGGKYYIHLNKHTGELYQAHYESNQFRNASDIKIDIKGFIEKYPELKDFYDKIWDMNNYKWWVLHNRQPTEKQQLVAVKRNGYAIKYIENPSEEVQLATIQQDPYAIQFIENPSEKVQLAAVNKNGAAIQYIDNPSEEVQLAAVQYGDEGAIGHIKNPSEEVQLAAVNKNGYEIKFIKNPSEKVQLAAVNKDGPAIKYIDNPSEKVQLLFKKMMKW